MSSSPASSPFPAPQRGAADRPIVDLDIHPSPHPFVRRGLVKRQPPGLPRVGLVTIRAPGGEVLGDGLWNEASDIVLRRLTTGDVRFDGDALRRSIDRAVTLRETQPGLAAASDAWRVLHSEADALSGLVVDRFGDVLSIELHSAGWVPLIEDVLAALHARLGTNHHRVTLGARTARLEGVREFELTSDGCPRRLRITEHGVRFEVDLERGHKTGFFCDQRDNRRDLAAWVEDADVLDACCYTGGFAVSAAARARPKSVTAVDLDEVALERARANANLNQVRTTLVHADAFDWLRQIGKGDRRFDVVVVDPPKFAPTRRDMERGRGKYHDLNRLAIRLVRPGGMMLTCSCSGLLDAANHTDLVRVAARKEGRVTAIVRATGAAPDHPVLLECPETEYLKALWMRVW